MNKLWFFFPENDIALAHGTSHFTAPPAATALRRSGEILPLWMASDGDMILCHGINEAWLSMIRSTFNIGADVWDRCNFNLAPTPWGWSAASKSIFVNEGFTENHLPDTNTLELFRQLSHRRTTSRLTEFVISRLPFEIYPAALEIENPETLSSIISSKATAVIKSPWSSSGRGVKFVDSKHTDSAVNAASGTIRKQGSVMVEDLINPHFDFALLFYCENCIVHFKGLSLFATEASTGQYAGNIVAPQEALYSRITEKIDFGQLETLIPILQEAITNEIASHYTGPVGVDMLADGEGKMHIVETNLRYTMGFLALGLARYVQSEALFHITKGKPSSIQKSIIKDGKLINGSLQLTPPGGDFAFILDA